MLLVMLNQLLEVLWKKIVTKFLSEPLRKGKKTFLKNHELQRERERWTKEHLVARNTSTFKYIQEGRQYDKYYNKGAHNENIILAKSIIRKSTHRKSSHSMNFSTARFLLTYLANSPIPLIRLLVHICSFFPCYERTTCIEFLILFFIKI